MERKYSKERLEQMSDEELDNLLMGEMFNMKQRELKFKSKQDSVISIRKAIREGDVDLFRQNISNISITKKLFDRSGWEDNDFHDYDVMEFLAQQIYYRKDKERYTYTKKYDGNIDSDIEMMKIVLDMGYDINKSDDKFGNKSLYLSILHNSTKVFKFLIDNGARFISECGGLAGDNPLRHAARKKNREMMDILLSIGIEDDEWGGVTSEQEYQNVIQSELEREERKKNHYKKKSLHYELMAKNQEYETLVNDIMNHNTPFNLGYEESIEQFKSRGEQFERLKTIFETETGVEIYGFYHDSRGNFEIE